MVREGEDRKTRSQSQSGTADSKNRGKQETVRAMTKQPHMCVVCADVVDEVGKSLPCDFCGEYTHLKCEVSMTESLYDAISVAPDNPLTYFCGKCRPMLVPDNSRKLLSGLIDRVTKIVTDQKRESLAEKIMNKMSSKISELDDLVREHRSAANKLDDRISKYDESIQDIRQLVTQSHKAVDESRQALSESRSTLNESKQNLELMISESVAHRSNRPQPFPIPPVPYPSFPQNNPRDPMFGPTQHQFSRPPPPSARNEPPRITPNPENTLVVYNTDQSQHIRNIAEDLMIRCNIYDWEVVHVDRLNKTNSSRSPIYIRCNNNKTRWNFMRDINQLKNRCDQYKKTYARPYLSGEDLRTDRNLFRKLTDIRKRHEQRVFKIYKGEIYEKTETSFEKFTDEGQHEISAEGDNSVDDMPALADTREQPNANTAESRNE